MKLLLWVCALTVTNASLAFAKPVTFQLGIGEQREFPISTAVGVVINQPEIADIQLIGKNRVQISGTAVGSAEIDVWTPSGQVVKHTVVVGSRGGRVRAPPAPSPFIDEGWNSPKFGGLHLEPVHCGVDLEPAARKQLREARALLAGEDILPAIARLERVIESMPEAIVARIFLGAAYQRIGDETRGITQYETYVLSCADDSLTPPLIGVLRDFVDRSGSLAPRASSSSLRKVSKSVIAMRGLSSGDKKLKKRRTFRPQPI